MPMLLTLSLGHVMADIYGGMLPAMLPIFVSTFGLSYFAVALVSASHSFSASAIQPVLGYVSDRFNGKLVLPLSPLVAALGVTVATQAPLYGLVLIAVAIGGLGIAAYHPEGYKAAGYYSGDRQSTGTSIFSVGGNLGVAAGPVVVAVLYAWQAQRGLILLVVPGVIMALVLCGSCRESRLRRDSAAGPQSSLTRYSAGTDTLCPPAGHCHSPLLLLGKSQYLHSALCRSRTGNDRTGSGSGTTALSALQRRNRHARGGLRGPTARAKRACSSGRSRRYRCSFTYFCTPAAFGCPSCWFSLALLPSPHSPSPWS